MKKYLLYILAVIILASCTKQPSFDPKAVAEQCMREHSYHPDQLKVLSCNAVLIPDTTIIGKYYHIAAVDGEPLSDRSWKNVTKVYTDSIRIEKHHHPEHYYCCATVECMDDCGNVRQGIGEVAVFPDGSAIMFRNFQDRYYKSISDTTYAQRDTLNNVKEHISYMREWNGWLLEQMLLK